MILSLLGSADRFVAAGNAARDRRDWTGAARNYALYLRRKPADAAIWIQYGHSLKETGLVTEASDAYQRAAVITPGDADLHLQIGHLNKITGNIRAAIASYRHALEIDPTFHAARQEIDRLQSVNMTDETRHWRVEIDGRLRDAMVRIELLERRITELESEKSLGSRSA